MKTFIKLLRKFVGWLGRLFVALFHKDLYGSGSGGSKSDSYSGINMVRSPEKAIGVGYHRSGWPYVLKHLKQLHCRSGILFDDFLEQNFCYNNKPTIYKKPWVAVFHHPKKIPIFGNYKENPEVILQSPAFIESVKNLKIAFALSDDLADWLKKKLPKHVKVVSLKHPIRLNSTKSWSPQAWREKKRIFQIGFYLRNTRLIEQIPHIDGVEVFRLWGDMDWLKDYDDKVSEYWSEKFEDSFDFSSQGYYDTRYSYRTADDVSVNFVLPSKYDDILDNNVVVVDYFACSASNVILECIANNTPIIVNRLPATEQYLGSDYPLFFTHPEEIPYLIDKVEDAHEYLKAMDKTDLHIDFFKVQLLKNIHQLNES